ncbi:hypothetical protein EVG20_g10022 [Dentipellis fragilis]|uniref:Uncharacterized protein n=1 Tax=Dentipellis fragilis TaxID=205917 RepID=A0A4Y9XUB3_9AGAM|nr:hypothetical protein EVG20_g10022 [Dentipellis fragilis]
MREPSFRIERAMDSSGEKLRLTTPDASGKKHEPGADPILQLSSMLLGCLSLILAAGSFFACTSPNGRASGRSYMLECLKLRAGTQPSVAEDTGGTGLESRRRAARHDACSQRAGDAYGTEASSTRWLRNNGTGKVKAVGSIIRIRPVVIGMPAVPYIDSPPWFSAPPVA